MTTTVKVIDIKGRTIDINDINPTSNAIPNEKLVFKDIPFSVNYEDIIYIFKYNQPGIRVKSGVEEARIRDNDNKLIPFYSGDKFVYVKDYSLHPFTVQVSLIITNAESGINHKRRHVHDVDTLTMRQ